MPPLELCSSKDHSEGEELPSLTLHSHQCIAPLSEAPCHQVKFQKLLE